ncbi:protein of unknown function DUF1428 [alpha proteobacterium U9-1i]|nr:protein of unknown function DUF1428 [alpha proteobacterium U9-1i]
MAYADGFLIPVPKKKLSAYKDISEKAGAIWMEHGALDYKECVGDDLFVEGMTATFPGTLNLKKGEAVIFSWILYKDRAHRDRVNKKVMADPRMAIPPQCPFDPARMLYGGFEALVDASTMKKKPARKAAKKAKKR